MNNKTRMTDMQRVDLAEEIAARTPQVDGWEFSYEFPGIFQFSKGNLCVACTPDWELGGVISVQVTTEDGCDLDSEDVEYDAPLTAERFVEFMRPKPANVASRHGARK